MDPQQIHLTRCDDAIKFAQIFLHRHDKEKDRLGELYHDAATLIWNGQCHKSKTAISKFYQAQKPTETSLEILDTQILPPNDTMDLTTIIAAGKIKQNDATMNFSRVFILGVQGTAGLIISDTMRLQT